MNINRQWLLAKRPHGAVGVDNFTYSETPIPEPGKGEALVRNLYLSYDPTQRGWMQDRESYMPPVAIGEVMRAGSIGQVVESNHDELAKGDLVQGIGGWQDFFIARPGGAKGDLVQGIGGWQDFFIARPGGGLAGVSKLPEGVPPTLFLSVLGVTGLTAYWGMLDLGHPKEGETVLVSGAAGATGSIAGQIGRIKGCRVVGIAGGPEKCAWLIDEAGFDDVIDYKNEDVDARIGETCPDKVDIFFDNVGGDILQAALNHLNMHARVLMCGGISAYNATDPVPGPANLMNLIGCRARMEGFLVVDYLDRSNIAVPELLQWLNNGDLKYQEDIQEGFENIPETFTRLFTGKNLGKQLLKLGDPT